MALENLLLVFAVSYGLLLASVFFYMYKKGKICLFSALTTSLASLFIYVTLSALKSISFDLFYVDLTGHQLAYFAFGNLLFLTVILLTYTIYKPKKKYPPPNRDSKNSLTYAMVVLMFVAVFGIAFLPNIPGLGRLVYLVGFACSAYLWALALHNWISKPFSITTIVFLGIACLIGVYAVFFGQFSRKPLLGFCLAPLIVLYFSRPKLIKLRYFVLILTPIAFVALTLLSIWTRIRVEVRDEAEGLSLTDAASLRADRFLEYSANANPIKFVLESFGDNSTAVSLATVHFYMSDMTSFEQKPFNTFLFVASNPIPRVFWPNKPLSLGYIFPIEMGVWSTTGFVNWGTTIIGHSSHEGGMHFIIFYGILYGLAIRRFDHYQMCNFREPECIAATCASFVAILGFMRGDFGVFTINVIVLVMVFFLIRMVRTIYSRLNSK